MLVEQLGYNILYRWFLGVSLEERIWDHSTFSQNQERLMGTDLAAKFLQKIIEQAKEAQLLSKDHFSVDGTLIEAWASIKSFQPRDKGPGNRSGRNDSVDFHGKTLKNETHASTTDPESRLFRKGKGKESKLCYMGHVLMENRNGLVVDTQLSLATGMAEREASAEMVQNIPGTRRVTRGDLRLDQDHWHLTKSSVSEPARNSPGTLPWRSRLTIWCGCETWGLVSHKKGNVSLSQPYCPMLTHKTDCQRAQKPAQQQDPTCKIDPRIDQRLVNQIFNSLLDRL